jgi:Tat protein secretion system quality control protein TatD with DNase activity
VSHTVDHIARAREIDAREMGTIVSENARRLFALA